MIVNFNVPIQVEIKEEFVQKYAQMQEKLVKLINEDIDDYSENIADGIATDFFREHVDIEAIEINGKGFYY